MGDVTAEGASWEDEEEVVYHFNASADDTLQKPINSEYYPGEDGKGEDGKYTDKNDARNYLSPEEYAVAMAELNSPKRIAFDFANVMKSFIGSNFLGMPYAFKKSGLYLGIIGISFIALITDHCCQLLVKVKKSLPEAHTVKTYGDVGERIWGRNGKIIIDSLLVFTQTGFCIGYLIFMGKNVETFLPDSIESRLRYLIAVVLPFLCVLPLTFVKNVKQLGPTSLIADVALFASLIAVYAYNNVEKAHETTGFNIMSFPVFLGIVTASYEGIGLVIPVEETMTVKPKRYPRLLDITLVIVSVLLGSFGILAYLTYGDCTEQIITLNLPKNHITDAVKIGLIVAIIFTFPMQMYPVTEIFDNLLLKNPSKNLFDLKTNLIRFVCCCFTLTVAYWVPFFGLIGGLVGALGSSTLAFILPVIFDLTLFGKTSPWYIKLKNVLILIFGAFSTVLGTILAVKDIVEALM